MGTQAGMSGHRCAPCSSVSPARAGSWLLCWISTTPLVGSPEVKVCTAALAAFLCLFLTRADVRTAQRTQRGAAPTTALAVWTPPPCVSRPRRPTVLCAGHPCSQGPTFLGCEGWPGDIKASGIPEDTQVSTAAAGSCQQGRAHRPATCPVQQAGVPTSRPPSGKANLKNTASMRGEAPRDGRKLAAAGGDHPADTR